MVIPQVIDAAIEKESAEQHAADQKWSFHSSPRLELEIRFGIEIAGWLRLERVHSDAFVGTAVASAGDALVEQTP